MDDHTHRLTLKRKQTANSAINGGTIVANKRDTPGDIAAMHPMLPFATKGDITTVKGDKFGAQAADRVTLPAEGFDFQ